MSANLPYQFHFSTNAAQQFLSELISCLFIMENYPSKWLKIFTFAFRFKCNCLRIMLDYVFMSPSNFCYLRLAQHISAVYAHVKHIWVFYRSLPSLSYISNDVANVFYSQEFWKQMLLTCKTQLHLLAWFSQNLNRCRHSQRKQPWAAEPWLHSLKQ